MNKRKMSKRAGKVVFFICCIILAIAFWFVVKYGQIDALAHGLTRFC